MLKVNKNFLNLKKSLLDDIEKKIAVKPKCELLNLANENPPFSNFIIEKIKLAIDEMKSNYDLDFKEKNQILKELIKKNESINLDIDEIFITNNFNSTIEILLNLFENNIISLPNPFYPIYEETNLIFGKKNKINYLPLLEENNFSLKILKKRFDIICLSLINNPTGKAINKKELTQLVEIAKKQKSLIIFDASDELFIKSNDSIHTIYEIDKAKDAAIEIKSFSKIGFHNFSYIIIPKKIKTKENVSINLLWKRFFDMKHKISYPVQKMIEAIYSQDGTNEIDKMLNEHFERKNILKKGLENLGFKVFGKEDSPYIWCKTINNLSSIEFFDLLLSKNIIVTPGTYFGKYGNGFVRFSSFTSKETIEKALQNLKNI